MSETVQTDTNVQTETKESLKAPYLSETEQSKNEIVIDEIILMQSVYLQFSPVNKPLKDIEFPTDIYVCDRSGSFYECTVLWDSLDSADTSSAGRKELRGQLVPPDGYVFAGGMEPIVSVPVLIYDENGDCLYIGVHIFLHICCCIGDSYADMQNTSEKHFFCTVRAV